MAQTQGKYVHDTLLVLAERAQHFKIAIGQSFRYPLLREDGVRFRSAIELQI